MRHPPESCATVFRIESCVNPTASRHETASAFVGARLDGVRLDEREDGGLLRREHLVLHEDAAQVFWPAVYVPRGETRQQRGLPRAVLADHAVLASPHESKVRRLQEHLPGEREDDPSQIQAQIDRSIVVVPGRLGVRFLAVLAAREMTHGALEESRDRGVVDELAEHGARGVHEFLHHRLRRPPGLALGQELACHVRDVLAHLLVHGRRGQQGLDVRQHIRGGHLAGRRRRLRPREARAASVGEDEAEGSFRRVPFFSLPSAVPGAFVFEIALRSFFQSENYGNTERQMGRFGVGGRAVGRYR
jgi:hypothetical protein